MPAKRPDTIVEAVKERNRHLGWTVFFGVAAALDFAIEGGLLAVPVLGEAVIALTAPLAIPAELGFDGAFLYQAARTIGAQMNLHGLRRAASVSTR